VEISESFVKQDLVETHMQLARTYEESGLTTDAVSEAHTVLNLAPWSREATAAREMVARLEGRPATEVHQRIFGLMELGKTYFAEHRIEPAILQYEKVLLVNPEHAIACKNLAFLNLQAGRLDVAYEQARRALQLEPDFQEAMMIKGHIEARNRRFRDSYDTYKRLGEIAREGSPIRQYAVTLAQKMRRFIELE
jgi:tetratricopeptide (TPR) repeat protein